jgi:Macrocin-O-methyltransferase (TylF)
MTSPSNERFSMLDQSNQTESDRQVALDMEAYFDQSLGTNIDKLQNFPKFVTRQSLSLFLAKHELFQKVVGVHGHLLECGVFLGGGLMSWAQLSAIYEPYNHVRRIIGFDTFTGFTSLHAKDRGRNVSYAKEGGLATDACDDIRRSISLYDLNRPIGHIPRVELVVGDASSTIPEYLAANPHLVVAMLYLDFDLYEPTKIAIESFLPRMPKGAIIAFDELNQVAWPGETQAVLETIGLRNLRIQRLPFTPQLSFAILD